MVFAAVHGHGQKWFVSASVHAHKKLAAHQDAFIPALRLMRVPLVKNIEVAFADDELDVRLR